MPVAIARALIHVVKARFQRTLMPAEKGRLFFLGGGVDVKGIMMMRVLKTRATPGNGCPAAARSSRAQSHLCGRRNWKASTIRNPKPVDMHTHAVLVNIVVNIDWPSTCLADLPPGHGHFRVTHLVAQTARTSGLETSRSARTACLPSQPWQPMEAEESCL